ILLNGARGDIVDYGALVDALRSGRFYGAGLDVFPVEPLPRDHPILGCAPSSGVPAWCSRRMAQTRHPKR
ncbi:MAG: NAD(P)-dependent oxidoreductase, partial [Gammaproteobacteria bacterium]